MKSVLSAVVASLVCSSGAFADAYMDCKKTGETDGRVTIRAPKVLNLEASRGISIRADGKVVEAEMNEEPRNLFTFTKTSGLQGNIIESKYTFDFRKCDSEQTGTASFSTELIGQADRRGTPPFHPTTATYDCECAED